MWTQAAGQGQPKCKTPVPSVHLLCVGEELLCVTDESCKAGRSALWRGSVLFRWLRDALIIVLGRLEAARFDTGVMWYRSCRVKALVFLFLVA